MPVSITNLTWTKLMEHPDQINNYQHWIKNQLHQHPNQFDHDYQLLLQFITLKNIITISHIDSKWIELIDTMTETYRQKYFGRPYPNYQRTIKQFVNHQITPIRKSTLQPIEFFNNQWLNDNLNMFEFTFDLIEDLNDFNLTLEQINTWSNDQLLNHGNLSYSIECYADSLSQIHHWQNLIIEQLIEQWCQQATQIDANFVKLLNQQLKLTAIPSKAKF